VNVEVRIIGGWRDKMGKKFPICPQRAKVRKHQGRHSLVVKSLKQNDITVIPGVGTVKLGWQ
jgi:hypothetical protein